MARCHRIGQTKPVVIYKLCAKGTIDEQIIKRGESKRKLERMVISEDFLLHLNSKDTLVKLKKLLESTDHDLATENGLYFWYYFSENMVYKNYDFFLKIKQIGFFLFKSDFFV